MRGTTIRPIQDFLNAQGKHCTDLVWFDICPDVFHGMFMGWTDFKSLSACVSLDYAGIESSYLRGQGIPLGTSFTGSVIEQPLANGQAKITVLLHTHNALAWAVKPDGTDCDWRNGAMLFGTSTAGVLDGKGPVLGDSFFMAVFINTAPGDPLPDLIDAYLAGNVISMSFRAQANGYLTDDAGEPTTPGRVEETQTGFINKTQFKGASADSFPVEKIIVQGVGK